MTSHGSRHGEFVRLLSDAPIKIDAIGLMQSISRIALACLALSGNAHSAGDSFARLHNFRVTLVDLNPDDNIDPSLTYRLGENSSSIGSVVAHAFSYDPIVQADTGGYFPGNPFQNYDWASNLTYADSRARMVSASTIDSLDILASGHAMAPLGTQTVFAQYSTDIDFGLEMLLSPMTSLEITADAEVTARVSVGYDPIQVRNESATGSTLLQLWDYRCSPGPACTASKDQIYLFTADKSNSLSEQRTMRIGLTNTGGIAHLLFYIRVYADGEIPFQSPVPEPSTYTLMLAGLGMLGMLGIASRRRKQ